VAEIARKGDLIITLGAGTIGGVGDRILTALDSAGEKTT
jgi:UDP-N-acetylmuramate-alanine ligase